MPSPPKAARRPCVALALAALLGVVGDYAFEPETAIALTAAAIVLGVTVALKVVGRGPWSESALLIVVALCFAHWHRARTRLFDELDIGNFAANDRRLASIEGRIDSPIRVTPAQAGSFTPWQTMPSTSFALAVERLQDGAGWRQSTGRLRATTSGELAGFARGDRIRLIGWLERPTAPQNPGEFNFAEHLLRNRIRCSLHCERTDGVTLLDTADRWQFARWIDRIRDRLDREFVRILSPHQAAIASALILGKRAALPDGELRPFLESGTLHLLVVSGMHVVMMYRMIWPLLVLLGLSLRTTSLLMLAIVPGYMLLTGGDPPVLRAAIVIGLALLGQAFHRPVDSLNALSAAAFFILALDPTTAYQSGVQLSFAAVLAIYLFSSRVHPESLGDELSVADLEDPRVRPARHQKLLRWFVRELVTSVVVWTLLAPLIAYRFHLVSPASVLLTPLLGPIISAIMLVGPLAIGLAAISGPLAWPFAKALSALIWFTQKAVGYVEHLPGGFVYVAGFGLTWVFVFYLLLFVPRCLWPEAPIRPRFAAPLLAWLLIGIVGELRPAKPKGAELHQIAVGHGLCTVLRFPNGANVMYDCGSMRGPDVCERVIAPWLWSQQIQRLDAVVISHADVDHFSGLKGLLRRFKIGAVYLTPQFVASTEPATRELLADLRSGSPRPILLWKDDELQAGDATLRVLHPRPMHHYESDNAASAVIECDWQGHRWLLTGDLAGSGLAEVMRKPLSNREIFAAPHHGSKSSNTPAVARWTNPRIVVSSDGVRRSKTDPLACYEANGALAFNTFRDGAVSCFAQESGLRVECFRSKRTAFVKVE